ILKHPAVFAEMFNPLNAIKFYVSEPLRAFIAMGSVVLAVTGAEALYADMGHFGRRPIKFSWLYFVMTALLLNYMGAGGMLRARVPRACFENGKDPFLLPGARTASPAAGHPGDDGHDHRQP